MANPQHHPSQATIKGQDHPNNYYITDNEIDGHPLTNQPTRLVLPRHQLTQRIHRKRNRMVHQQRKPKRNRVTTPRATNRFTTQDLRIVTILLLVQWNPQV